MATLTLKNVPDDLYDRLKHQAARHRRSLNQEVIAVLEGGGGIPPEEDLLARVDALRERLAAQGTWATAAEVDAWINEGHS